jgi:DNA-binding transcriptional LysR family regulator
MQDLERMAIFARVIEAKSFSRAAERLNISKSLVSKQISELEKSIGARLLNRTTRALSLTNAGELLYEHCVRIVDELEMAKFAVSRLHTEPRGLLRISSSVAFGRLHVAPALHSFLAAYPALKIDMVTTDRFVDLAEEGYDVVLRITGEPAPNLVARKLAPVIRKMCATPEYFRRHSIPRAPDDLERHNCLTYSYLNVHDSWRLRGPDGDISIRHVQGNLKMNDDDALAEAVLSGVGIALLPTFIVGEAIKEGRLQAVLSEYVPIERYIYAIYLPTRNVSAKVRAFIDHLLDRFGSRPYWDGVEASC